MQRRNSAAPAGGHNYAPKPHINPLSIVQRGPLSECTVSLVGFRSYQPQHVESLTGALAVSQKELTT